jgi:hypothetical protein
LLRDRAVTASTTSSVRGIKRSFDVYTRARLPAATARWLRLRGRGARRGDGTRAEREPAEPPGQWLRPEQVEQEGAEQTGTAAGSTVRQLGTSGRPIPTVATPNGPCASRNPPAESAVRGWVQASQPWRVARGRSPYAPSLECELGIVATEERVSATVAASSYLSVNANHPQRSAVHLGVVLGWVCHWIWHAGLASRSLSCCISASC